MSEEKNVSEKEINEAWEAFQKQIYEVIKPRFYRVKKGRKLEYINPWLTIQERIAAENKQVELWRVWNKLYGTYVLQTGIRLPVEDLYKEEETPNGVRYKKK